MEGRAHLLKEYSIGIEVFGKEESFDPRVDTIVRAEARKLRSRIAKYYEEEGKHDPLRIDFVKGSYAPVFHNATEPKYVPREPVPNRRPRASDRAATWPS